MKRILSTILAALLLAALLTLPARAAETGYTDIPSDAWYAWCVSDATDRGLMNGTGGGTFTPDGDLTRAMLVTVLWRLAGEPDAENPAAFTDVPAGQWYSDAVAWASGFSVVEGYGGGVFGTDDPVTREQMAVIFFRWAQGKRYDVTISDRDIIPAAEAEVKRFEWVQVSDGHQGNMADAGCTISDWAVDAVVWAAEHNFLVRRQVTPIDPYGNSTYAYCAPYTATRAEVAVFLSRFCQAYVDEPTETARTIPYEWDILTLSLPESWQGNYVAYTNEAIVGPKAREVRFWDLSNKEPRSDWGFLFILAVWPAGVESTAENFFLDPGDAAPGKSGRICTVETPEEGKLNIYVYFPDTEPYEDGSLPQYFDPEDPKNYPEMRAQVDDILNSIRFAEGVKVLDVVPGFELGSGK